MSILDVIDFIVAPLTELRPIKFLTDSAYRSVRKRELGRRAWRILFYQAAFSVLIIAGIAASVAVHCTD